MMLSPFISVPPLDLRPLAPRKRQYMAIWTYWYRVTRYQKVRRITLVPPYSTVVGTPGPSGLTVAPGLTIPWPQATYRVYGEYLAARGFEPRPPRRHPEAYDAVSTWYKPHMFPWTLELYKAWQSRAEWAVYADADSRMAHLCFRPHGSYHDGRWAPNPDDSLWTPTNTPPFLGAFAKNASRLFSSFNDQEAIPVGEWLATWGPHITTVFPPRWPFSPLRRMMMVTVMLLATGVVTLEYRDRDEAESALTRRSAITRDAQQWAEPQQGPFRPPDIVPSSHQDLASWSQWVILMAQKNPSRKTISMVPQTAWERYESDEHEMVAIRQVATADHRIPWECRREELPPGQPFPSSLPQLRHYHDLSHAWALQRYDDMTTEPWQIVDLTPDATVHHWVAARELTKTDPPRWVFSQPDPPLTTWTDAEEVLHTLTQWAGPHAVLPNVLTEVSHPTYRAIVEAWHTQHGP